MRWVRVVWLLFVVGVVVPWSSASAQPAGNTYDGEIVDFDIRPPQRSLVVGDTIVFTSNAERPHPVTDRGGVFDTDPILPGGQGRITFTVPGTYEVFCRINPARMNATIVVEPGPEPPTEVRVQAFDENREGAAKRFDPDRLEVDAGTTITLANVGGLPHTLTAVDGSFTTGVVAPGAEQGRFAGDHATVVVDEPGTYEFFCEIHPAAMRGMVVVTGDPPDEPPTTTAPDDQDAAQAAPAPARAAVTIVDFAFEQTEVSVAPGGTVTWTNSGGAPHTATFDDVELDTGTIDPGGAGELTAPAEPGTYSYFCAIHPSMRAALLVPPPIDAAADGAAEDETDDEAAARKPPVHP